MRSENDLINNEELELPKEVSEEYFEVNPSLENTLDLSLVLKNMNKDTLGENKNE